AGRVGLGRKAGLADVPGLGEVNVRVFSRQFRDPSSVSCLGLPRIFLAERARSVKDKAKTESVRDKDRQALFSEVVESKKKVQRSAPSKATVDQLGLPRVTSNDPRLGIIR
ncbi:hypothetical protein ALC57_01235, partial [Trachymyrmex cornetzi]